MPNHWETSARPLFIKTVFVNGNRHAILFEKDPLLRCGNSQFKKISRPNSSLSYTSDISITTSNSQDSNSEGKSFKLKNFNQTQRKDLSLELQNCLVKLKLNSGNFKNQNKTLKNKSFGNFKEEKECQSTENGKTKQKRSKEKHDKIFRKKQMETYNKEPNQYKVTERKNSCYVYNLENYKGKKNYCFVKITSQPPEFVLNCSCENGSEENHNCDPSVRNNMVISATIHNLIMKSNENENFLDNTFKYVFSIQNPDLNWNDYLGKSCCNSLSERVFQWLELARKKQKKDKLHLKDEKDFFNSSEIIFSRKKFADEIKQRENLRKKDNKIVNVLPNQSEEEVEGEVLAEPNVETLLSSEKSKNTFEEYSEEINPPVKVCRKSISSSALNSPKNEGNSTITSNLNLSPFIQDPGKETLSTPILNLIKSPLKIQDLLLNCSTKNSLIKNNDRKLNNFVHQKKGNSILNRWEKITGKKSVFVEKFDTYSNQSNCHYDGNTDENTDKEKEQILQEEFSERNQKSINNLNITRTSPLLIPNLSPQQQQHDRKSHLQEEEIVWASEKTTGRPQLHIFMPSIVLKDQSDDGFSESENILQL